MSLQRELISPNHLTVILIHLIFIVLWSLPFFIGKMPVETVPVTFLENIELFAIPPFLSAISQYILCSTIGLMANTALDKLKIFSSSHNFLFYYLWMITISFIQQIHLLTQRLYQTLYRKIYGHNTWGLYL